MDSNAICLFSVAVVWLISLRSVLLNARNGAPGWTLVYAFVLAVLLLGLWQWPDDAGHVAAALYGVLVFAPSLMGRRMARLTTAQRFDAALPWAYSLVILHPADGYRELPAMLRALRSANAGDFTRAEAALNALSHSSAPSIATQARLHLFRLLGDWSGYLHATRAFDAERLRRDPPALNGRLRALGETSELDSLVRTYVQAKGGLEHSAHALQRAFAQLFVCAFTGRDAALLRVLNGPLRDLDNGTRRYWMATSDHAQGREEQAHAEFSALSRDENRVLARAAEQRLAQPRALATSLNPELLSVLDELEREVTHQERYESATPFTRAKLCLILIGLNLVAFGYELSLGGSEQPAALYEAGALLAGELTLSDSYRLLTALFLHFGWLHLSMNMLNLAAIGPFVEARLGISRTLAVYLTSGLVGATLVAFKPASEPSLFLGASGCIMGLLGATAAILLHGQRRENAQPAKRRLWRIALVLAIQLAFDLSIPGISLIAHWTGVVVGFALAYVFSARRNAR